MAKPKKIDYQKTYPTTYNYISALKAAFPQYKKYKHEDFFNLYDQIARVETNDQNIAQIGGGPGRGYYQVEGPSAKTAYARSQNIAKELEARGQKIKLPTFKEDFTQLDKDSQTFYITSNLIGAAAQKRKKDPNYYLDPTNPEKVWLELHWAGDPKDLPARQKRFREVNPVQKAQIEKAITPVTTERDVDWGNLLNTFIQTPTLLPAVLQANFGETPQKKNGGPVYNWIPEYPRTGAKYAQGGWLEKYANGSVVDIIKGSYINPFNWGVSDYSNVKNFSKAYEQAKKAGEEEFLWNGKRYNTKYAGTPRQEVGAYGVQGKPVNTKYINNPAQVNLYPPSTKYPPGHIAASIADNQTSVDYSSAGNYPYGLRQVKNADGKSFNIYGQDNLTFSNKVATLPILSYLQEGELIPSTWNLFTNNCADNVCDAFGIPRSKGIQTPGGAMQKIQKKYPTLDVTGRTYEDYYALYEALQKQPNEKILSQADNILGIASSPEIQSTDLGKRLVGTIQAALGREGYKLPKSRIIYDGVTNGNETIPLYKMDGIIGPETLNALKVWQSKNAVNKKANGGTIEDQRIPTPTTPSYYPDYPDRTLTNYQMGTPKAPMYAHGATVYTNQEAATWVNGTEQIGTQDTRHPKRNTRTESPATAMPYPEIKITGPTNPYMPASPPVLQGYNPYKGPMRLHAPDTTQIARHGGRVTKKAGIPYAINPGVSDAGMYVGPTTQRGITFGNGGPTGVPPASRQDSIFLLNSVNALNKYYQTDGFHDPTPEKDELNIISMSFAGEEEKDNLKTYVRYLKDFKEKGVNDSQYDDYLSRDPSMTPIKYLNLLTSAIKQIKDGNPYRSYYRDLYPSRIDIEAPAAVVDTRIKPQGFMNYKASENPTSEKAKEFKKNKEARKLGGSPAGGPAGIVSGFYYYDPLAITPWDMLTEAQKKQRVTKYGTSGTPVSSKKPTNTSIVKNVSEPIGITKIPMRGIPLTAIKEAVPQKVTVPKTNLIPTQYMDTRGEWSSTPQVPPGYTEEQLLKMGYRAPQKKANGGWLDFYEEGGEVDLNKPYLNPATVQSVLAKANQPVTTTTGRVISTPASREKERREKIIAKDPSKYSVEDYKQGIKEPGLEDATLEAIDALSMLSGAGYLGKKGVELGVKEIGKGVKNLIYKGVDPMFYNPTEKIKSFVPNLLSTEKDKIKRVEKIMRDSGVTGSYRKAQNRLDAWRVGLGLPQKYNTFKEIGENTFTINPKFFTLNPEVQQSIIAHAKAFNLKDKYLNNVITSEQYEKGLVNINKKMHDRLGDTFYGRYVKEENIPFQPKAIVERKGDKGFSMYDQDRYAGVMGGFRWDIEDLPDNKIKLIARDTWDLYPFNKRGATKFSDLTSLKRQKELNKGYIPALKNVEMLKLVGGKPYNIENTFIVDKYKQGGWLDNL